MFPDALTARAVLYDNASHEVGRAELTARLRELGFDREIRLAAPALGPLVRDLALPEIAAAVDGLLDISVGDAALAGWRGYDRLRGAAQRTRTGPEENVELLAHDLTHTYRPRLEILVDGQSSGSLTLELVLALEVQPLAATVRDAHLVALGLGDCTVSVSVGTASVGTIIERRRDIPTARMVDLRRPVPLLLNGRPGPQRGPRPST
ncbi:hypothetical protein [Nocardia neocaledoniensis]|uniref:hypothetical protein n=1 Tax=Nocardia neocaledoniensis TaxID=236511 RepID=UPI002454789F|nr:hypothetical protein [Nocardia neocaledoniensis]